MDSNLPVIPTPRDVLNGRGQGIQRHPGNIKYRKLVFANKGIYAKCSKGDKIKISRGIVAAIRQSGGRFLEHNERTDVYFDIGDKKATEKASQALREGQKDIRKKMYKREEGNSVNSAASDESKPFSNVTMPAEPEVLDKPLPAEDYSKYSFHVLEALYNSESDPPAPTASEEIPQPVKQQPLPFPPPAPVHNNVNNDMHGIQNNAYMGTSGAAMAMALDHFPAARMPAQPMPQPNKNMPFAAMLNTTQQQSDYDAPMLQHQTDGRDSSNPSFRLTDMSLGTRQLLESSQGFAAHPSNRGTVEGTGHTFQSQPQLNQIEQMELNDLIPTQDEIDGLFDRNTEDSFDHFSDMPSTEGKIHDLQETERITD